MKKLSNKGKYFLEISVLISALILACFFWNSPLVFPVKLFVVLLHEGSHALVTLFTGGSVSGITVNFQIGGDCISKGGNPALIACAGYPGSIILGGIFFYSSISPGLNRTVCNCFAFFFILMLAFIRGSLGVFFTLFLVLFLILLPRVLPKQIQLMMTSVLGALSILYAFIDMQEDLFQGGYRQTDAQTIAAITGFPALLWSILWLTLSIVILYLLLKKKFRTNW